MISMLFRLRPVWFHFRELDKGEKIEETRTCKHINATRQFFSNRDKIFCKFVTTTATSSE